MDYSEKRTSVVKMNNGSCAWIVITDATGYQIEFVDQNGNRRTMEVGTNHHSHDYLVKVVNTINRIPTAQPSNRLQAQTA